MMTGNNIGNARTVKSAPRALDLEMIAAINVEPADNPMPPIIKMIRKDNTPSTEKFITAKNNGKITTCNARNNKKLNINFPRNILIGNATSFNVSAVCFSSSLIKIWDNPDMALLAEAHPPYTDWKLTELNYTVHCPVIRPVGNELWIAGKTITAQFPSSVEIPPEPSKEKITAGLARGDLAPERQPSGSGHGLSVKRGLRLSGISD